MAKLSKGAQLFSAGIEKKGWSVYRAAKKSGFSQSYLGLVLKGDRGVGRRLSTWAFKHLGIPLESWDEPADEATEEATGGEAA